MNADIYGEAERLGIAGGATRYLDRAGAGVAARWLLWALLFGCLFVLGMELRDIVDAGRQSPAVVTVEPTVVRRDVGPIPDMANPRPVPRIRSIGLDRPIAFRLEQGGILSATGTIDEGAAAQLEAELARDGGNVRVVSLNSPGGSLDDAILMARIIRARGLATKVEDGALCASSCPLLFAGGVERHVGAGAAVAVHQFYASTDLSEDPAQAMADAQLMTARIVRHLARMGVDPALWFNALATPPQSLYYLSRSEMADYRLLTASVTTAENGGS